MMIARTLSRLLVAAGFALSSLASAQGQTETPAAPDAVAPEAAPEGDPAAPARSVLWPDFQVGQHVVLEMTYLDTSKAPKPVLATVTVEVIDKTDDVFTIRWTPSNVRIPRDFPNPSLAPFACVWNGTAGPTLEILIQEDVGVIALKNWEAARDQTVADAKRALVGITDGDAVITPERADQVVNPMRNAILASKDAVEATLLRSVRGYFDGSYHEVAPGKSFTEELELPWPFGDAAEGLFLPMTRTTTVTTITTDPAPVYELLIDLKPDAQRFKELVTSIADQLPASLKSDEAMKRAESAVEIKVRWRLDTAKGWPTRASSTARSRGADQTTTQTVTWTLVDGPTMKAAEPKPDAAPAQPDAAQPNPAPSDAPADPK